MSIIVLSWRSGATHTRLGAGTGRIRHNARPGRDREHPQKPRWASRLFARAARLQFSQPIEDAVGAIDGVALVPATPLQAPHTRVVCVST